MYNNQGPNIFRVISREIRDEDQRESDDGLSVHLKLSVILRFSLV